MYGSTTKGDVVKRSDCILDAWKIQQSHKKNQYGYASDMHDSAYNRPIADPIIGATLVIYCNDYHRTQN